MTSRQKRKVRARDREQMIARFERERRMNPVTSAAGVFDYTMVLDNLKAAFNIAKIIRSADAFGAREVHVVGTPFFDPRPAMGSFRWVPCVFHKTFADSHEGLARQGYTSFLLEAHTGDPLGTVPLPAKSAFIFGHEEFGPSFDPADYPEIRRLSIRQFGKVESLNVSIAASIMMYEYARQHGTERERSIVPPPPRGTSERQDGTSEPGG